MDSYNPHGDMSWSVISNNDFAFRGRCGGMGVQRIKSLKVDDVKSNH